MARTVEFIFDTVKTSSSNGQINAVCENSDTPGVEWDFYIEITAPSGEVIKTMPDSPDLTLDGDERDGILVDIPLDSNGDYMEGEYAFRVRRVAGDVDTTVSDTYDYIANVEPNNLGGVAVLATSFSCLTGKIIASDETPYTAAGLTLVTRSVTITPPTIDTQDAATTNSASTYLIVGYSNVTYQSKLDIEFTWGDEDLGDGISASAEGSIILYEETLVECEDGGICESIECIGDALSKAYNEACAAGGYSRLAQGTKDKIEWSMLNLAMAKMKYDCGEVDASQTYLERAKQGINCGCGCSGTESNSPKPFTPPGGVVAVDEDEEVVLSYWVESQSGGGSIWTPVAAGSDNYDAIIVAKGTGSFRARAGGDARGQYAIDLQLYGSANNKVASGARSVAVGYDNRSAGADSITAGSGNTNTGANSVVVGKGNSTAEVDAVLIGDANTVAGLESVAVGKANNVEGANSVAVGSTNNVQETDSVAIGGGNTLNDANSIAIGDGNEGQGTFNVLIGSTNEATGDDTIAIGDGNASSADHTTLIGTALSADADATFVTGRQASAHLARQMSHGINEESLQRTIVHLSRSAITGNSAFILTAVGGNTLDLALPAGNHIWGCRLHILASIIATDGGFSVADSFMGQRQFVVSKNGSTIALQGSVVSVGTDVATASMSALAVDVSVNDTTDQIEIEITPPVAMGAGDQITVFATIEALQIALA